MEGYSFGGWFVMVLGMGTVFVGLILLIYLTKLMSFLCGLKKEPVPPAPVKAQEPESDRPQLVAAIASAIAEHMGTEPDGLRIHSIRRAD